MRIGLWDLFQMAMKMAYKGELLEVTNYLPTEMIFQVQQGAFQQLHRCENAHPTFHPELEIR